jgi:hypothetical protein
MDLSLHTLWRAVGAPDTNLFHSDGVSLPHARSGNIRWRGHKYFNAVFANEAVEGCEPFLIFWTGERKVVSCIRICLLRRRVEGRKVGHSSLEIDWRRGILLVVSHRETLLGKQIEALDSAGDLHLQRRHGILRLSERSLQEGAKALLLLLLELLLKLVMLQLKLLLQVIELLLRLLLLLLLLKELLHLDVNRAG